MSSEIKEVKAYEWRGKLYRDKEVIHGLISEEILMKELSDLLGHQIAGDVYRESVALLQILSKALDSTVEKHSELNAELYKRFSTSVASEIIAHARWLGHALAKAGYAEAAVIKK